MVGEEGEAVSSIQPTGKVFVHGEYWNATSEIPVAQGEKIKVIGVKKNMELEISPLREGEWFSDKGGLS
jgi:membrane-bound serine protease (ClpP class)